MWNICKYFDDHFEGVVSKHETKEQAKEELKKLKNSVYTSYEIKEF